MPSALITGGAVRLGRSFALHLANKGYGIALHYGSSAHEARSTITEIELTGAKCRQYQCDFRNSTEVEVLIEKVLKEFPDLDLLINNSANFIQENIEETQTLTLANTLNLNLVAPYILMRDYKRKVGRGLIVNILDQRIQKYIPTFAAYSVSKSALAHLTQLAAIEWGASVRVNGIAPGLILPPPWKKEEYLKQRATQIPVQDHGQPEDLLRGLDYLLDSHFVNGEILFIDGGESKNSSIPSEI
tara:strand:+ start:175 stop:906 length:732 start_codon:yes stop_codon:yes gene_type:complete